MNFDKLINEKKCAKEELWDTMESQKIIFKKELNVFIVDHIEKNTLSTIKENSEKIFELGEEKAKEMKEEIALLKENIPNLIEKFINDVEVWWHTNEDDMRYYSKNGVLDKHDERIKYILGHLGYIFNKYKIVKILSEYDRSFTSNSSWSYGTLNNQKLVKYGYGLSYPTTLNQISNEYIKLIDQAQKVNKEIKELEDNKKKENIEEWWKSL